jgi:hypothetical protein
MDALRLIDDLSATLRAQLDRARSVRSLPVEQLKFRPAPDQWNALELFEHLNLSSGIYLRGLERVFDDRAEQLPFNSTFTPGRFGAYFTKGMLPKADGSIGNRMRTLRMFDPARRTGAELASVDRFIDLCERFLRLLQRARHTDLNRMRVTSSLGPIIRFKAGDAFRFPIAHQQRHFLQIERLLAGTAQRETTNRSTAAPARSK